MEIEKVALINENENRNVRQCHNRCASSDRRRGMIHTPFQLREQKLIFFSNINSRLSLRLASRLRDSIVGNQMNRDGNSDFQRFQVVKAASVVGA